MNRFDLIILDLDGTLYDLDDVLAGVYESQVEFLMQKWNKPKEDVVAFLTENHVYPYRSRESQSATELFMRNGIDKDEWTAWRNSHFDEKKIKVENAASEDLIVKLAELSPVILLSSNTYNLIQKILNHIGIRSNLFLDIYCSDKPQIVGRFNKTMAVKMIAERHSVLPTRILSIGDRYKTDIQPILEFGGKGVLIENPQSIKQVSKDLSNEGLCSCNSYKYFGNV